MNNNEELNRAIVLYLGFGFAPMPRLERTRIINEFGIEKADKLESFINSILEELGRINVDWSIHTLESASKVARLEMHRLYPNLSDVALRALEWKFTFDWR